LLRARRLAGPAPARERERLDLPTQRARLNRLARELEIDPRALTKDQSGNWMLEAAHGSVHALPRGGYELIVECKTTERWAWAKARLDFAFVFKQNELSGTFWLSKMPDAAQGDAIVAALGLPRPGDVVIESTSRILSWRAP
jgi:hypothetical protein